MPHRPATFRPNRSQADQRLSSRDRGYSSAWDKASKLYRRLHPLCEYCDVGALAEERAALCTRVDHLYPQRRFAGVFWVQALWVASCDECDAVKQALEHGPIAALDELARRLGRPTLAELGLSTG